VLRRRHVEDEGQAPVGVLLLGVATVDRAVGADAAIVARLWGALPIGTALMLARRIATWLPKRDSVVEEPVALGGARGGARAHAAALLAIGGLM